MSQKLSRNLIPRQGDHVPTGLIPLTILPGRCLCLVEAQELGVVIAPRPKRLLNARQMLRKGHHRKVICRKVILHCVKVLVARWNRG